MKPTRHEKPVPSKKHETNRHPVDRMADLKAQMRALEEEFDELREGVVSGEIVNVGEDWIANVTRSGRRSISVADAEKFLDPETFASIVKSSESVTVRLAKRGSCK